MDIFAVREAIAAAVHETDVLGGTLQLTATAWLPDSLNAPQFFIADYEVDLHKSMGGLTVIEFTARVLTGMADERSAQEATDVLFSPTGATSLKALIEAERNHSTGALGGLVDDLTVTRVRGNLKYTHNGIDYVGGEITIRVIGD